MNLQVLGSGKINYLIDYNLHEVMAPV
eukprot:gene16943-19364_t